MSRNKHRTIYQPVHPITCTLYSVPTHWCHDQDPDRTPVYSNSSDDDQDPDSTPVFSDSPDEEEDFPTVPLDDKHLTSDIVPERTFCMHENGLPNNICQHPCPYGNNDTASYMDSLDLSDISDYEDYMVTPSNEELLQMEEVPY